MGAMTMMIAGASGTMQGGPQGSMPLPEAQRTQMLKQIAAVADFPVPASRTGRLQGRRGGRRQGRARRP